MSFYAVRHGRLPGIYKTWDECKKQIHRFTGAQYKKFKTHSDAQDYLEDKVKIQKTIERKSPPKKTKTVNNIPMNLIRATIDIFFPTTTTSTDEPSTQTDTAAVDEDDQKSTYQVVYSDGCCFSNGSATARAGYGVYWGDNHPWNVSGRLQGNQTNQRAELMAAAVAMETALKNKITHLEIRTDSKYTIQSATEWIAGWKRNNWIKKTDSKPVINQDLMMKIDELQSKLKVKWTYVAGHSSNKGNDAADHLAKTGALQS